MSDEHARLFEWIVRGGETDGLPALVEGFVRAQEAATPRETAALVREYRLPREALQPEHLTSPEVWEALLEDMPMTALIRNLATMTRVGVLAPGSDGTAKAVAQLGDAGAHPPRAGAPDRRAGGAPHLRVRPRRARPRRVEAGARGRGRARRRVLRGVRQRRADGQARCCSRSTCPARWTWGRVAGVPGLTPRDASAALALVTAATEERYEIVGFTPVGGFRELGRRARRYWTASRRSRSRRGSGSTTPCGRSPTCRSAAPTVRCRCCTRRQREREIDTFVIYTDSETWAGDVHPAQALRDYRHASGIDARLVVVGMVSNGFSIADPADPGMLDVVGFDTATPQLISDFARGAL